VAGYRQLTEGEGAMVGSSNGRVWFAVWVVLAAGWMVAVLGVMSIGMYLVPPLGVLTIVAVGQEGGRRAWAGAISGAGLPLLYVAYLNRGGPATVCHSTAIRETCTEEFSPWPFLVLGVLAVVAGALVQRARCRGAGAIPSAGPRSGRR
jgi:hypothetical protein